MFERPRLRRTFFPVPLEASLILLLSDERQVFVEGRIHARLISLLDGSRTLAGIATEMAPDVSFPEVVAAIDQLGRSGYLEEGETCQASPSELFRDAFLGAPRQVNGAPIPRVRAVGGASADPVVELLSDSGFRMGEGEELLLVVTDDYLRDDLGAINEIQIRSGQPWMIVKPSGFRPWIGPIFVPGETGCWDCMAQRLRANRQMEKYILDRREQPGPIVTSLAALGSTERTAASLALHELERHFSFDDGGSLAGRLLTLDLKTRETREHVLVRRPQCRSCGDGKALSSTPPGPVTISARPKHYRADGGHRSLTPEETLERFGHHVSPVLGAVTDLSPALGRYDPELTPTWVAGHNFSMGVESVVFLRESLRGMSGGKGTSPAQAKVSGLCEAIERYSGMWSGEEFEIRGTYDALKPAAIHPNECMGFSDEQYRDRESWNARQAQPPSRCVLVPRPFDQKAEVSWTPLWSLTHERTRLLPSSYCYYGHPDFSARQSIPDSNGCAAGTSIEEAILQGFMEVVERDAVALWWYNRIRRRGVDLDSFDLPYLSAIQKHYETLGRSLWVLDITSDLGITTMACVSARLSGPAQDILLGFGAHFDPKVALLRSITEVNQFLPSVSTYRPDGTTLYLFGDGLARDWWTTARLEDLAYLLPDPDRPPVSSTELPDHSTDDLGEDVRHCVETVRSAGLEMLVLDMTRPDIGLSVVRVAVPGLCHFWRRLGFTRLFDVPVRQGWRQRPLASHELNPHTIFF